MAVVRGAEADLANQDLDTGKCRSYSDVYRRLAMRSGADGWEISLPPEEGRRALPPAVAKGELGVY